MKIVKTGILVFTLASFMAAHTAFAGPAKGTSAEAAAILENHPPAGWLSHYLGEDRYKIAGGVWRVLSTQRDKHFHRPNCSKMLRQAPGIVIGFPTIASAWEAGYLPDSHCNPTASATTINIGGAVTSRPQQIRLSDGKSTVILPAGWRKVQSQKINNKILSANIDSFAPGKSLDSGVSIISFNFPGGNPEPLTAAKAKEYMEMYNRSGYVNSALPSTNDQMNVSDIIFKGMRGVRMTPKSKAKGDGVFFLAQKGARMYVVAAGGEKGLPKGATSIINSYQPR